MTKIKKTLAAIVAATTMAVSMGSVSVNAGYTSMTGSENYGSCYYMLSVNNCKAYGSFTSHSAVTRHCKIQVYLASSQTSTPLSGSVLATSSDVAPGGHLLTGTKDHSGHSSYYKHYYKAVLYGGAYGSNVPVVETIYLNLNE